MDRKDVARVLEDIAAMLESVGAKSLDALMAETLPSSIRQRAPLDLGPALRETEALTPRLTAVRPGEIAPQPADARVCERS